MGPVLPYVDPRGESGFPLGSRSTPDLLIVGCQICDLRWETKYIVSDGGYLALLKDSFFFFKFSKDPTKGETRWWVQESCLLRTSPTFNFLDIFISLGSAIKGGQTARMINNKHSKHLMKNSP